MRIYNPFILILVALTLSFSACHKTKTQPDDHDYLHGIYVINEGEFQKNNGSVSFIKKGASEVQRHIFLNANGRSPGDIIQSMGILDDQGFIVANNSEKVEIIDLNSFTVIDTIMGADYPRHFLPIDANKGYLTNGAFAGNVYVIDLSSNLIINSIDVGNGPENMVRTGNRVWVANSGGWVNDSTLTIIDAQNDKVEKTIKVGDNPTDLVVDRNGDIWVLCKGKMMYDQNWNLVAETDSRLVKIDGNSLSVSKSFIIGEQGDYFSPIRLAIGFKGEMLYYAEVDGVYKMNINDSSPPLEVYIGGQFYGLDVDPDQGTLYALDAKNFSGAGKAYRYSTSGSLIDSLEVGVAPNGVVFN